MRPGRSPFLPSPWHFDTPENMRGRGETVESRRIHGYGNKTIRLPNEMPVNTMHLKLGSFQGSVVRCARWRARTPSREVRLKRRWVRVPRSQRDSAPMFNPSGWPLFTRRFIFLRRIGRRHDLSTFQQFFLQNLRAIQLIEHRSARAPGGVDGLFRAGSAGNPVCPEWHKLKRVSRRPSPLPRGFGALPIADGCS
jgi:hypothetical protein